MHGTRISRRKVIASSLPILGASAAGCWQSQPTAGTPPYLCRVLIHGAYGLVHSTTAETVTVATVRDPSNPCGYDYTMHPMLLILRNGGGEVVAGETTQETKTDGDDKYWALEGEWKITAGVVEEETELPHASSVDDLIEPWVPINPGSTSAWDDLIWLPEIGRVSQGWEAKTTARFVLPGGRLSLLAPMNDYAKLGRWRFALPNNQTRASAVTDVAMSTALAFGAVTISSGDKRITLKAGERGLELELASRLRDSIEPISVGDPIKHLPMLYDLVGSDCIDRPTPTFEKVPGREYPKPEESTPGALCPLALMHSA